MHRLRSSGAIAFSGSQALHPQELYYMVRPSAAPQQLTHFNDSIAALPFGRCQGDRLEHEGFAEDGTLTLPPDYDPARAYPLVLVIHGGPNSASITRLAV